MKYSDRQIQDIIEKKKEAYLAEYGLKTAKKIIAGIKKKLLAENRRRKNLEGGK